MSQHYNNHAVSRQNYITRTLPQNPAQCMCEPIHYVSYKLLFGDCSIHINSPTCPLRFENLNDDVTLFAGCNVSVIYQLDILINLDIVKIDYSLTLCALPT